MIHAKPPGMIEVEVLVVMRCGKGLLTWLNIHHTEFIWLAKIETKLIKEVKHCLSQNTNMAKTVSRKTTVENSRILKREVPLDWWEDQQN
jgi:hypothetical protein